jgi:hypothetical protein
MNQTSSWANALPQSVISQMDDNLQAYCGVSTASSNNRSFLDIEPNISVRDEFLPQDYYAFRPGEDPFGRVKFIIDKSNKAYKRVGLVRNVIDLMGDFGSQGITVNHPVKKIERFCRRWWTDVQGPQRSERFLNLFYRTGNVIIYRVYGNMTNRQVIEYSKAKRLPHKYIFLNPMSVDVDGDYSDVFGGELNYVMKLGKLVREAYSGRRKRPNTSSLPPKMRAAIESGKSEVPLDSNDLLLFFYKKDDWDIWASPMLEPILDDITMLEKMKLADVAALDGVISNVRLWNLGDLGAKIMPNRGAIDRLRDILASHTGGGTMDLVWGPELSFTESNTQIYKWLGDEKYGPVLASIYGGLGIPQTLTGRSDQSGGFTNNFVSMKTLIERLQYGRDTLAKFWNGEFKLLADTFGFTPPTLHFDNIILSDEAAQHKLLIELADRNIISDETLRERLGENNKIEDARVRKQHARYRKHNWPHKAGAFHNGNLESEYVKIALQQDRVDIDDVIPYDAKEPTPEPDSGQPGGGSGQNKKPRNDNGRPNFSKDQEPRKQRRVLPRSSAQLSDVLVWASEARKTISEMVNPVLLQSLGKTNLRELSRAELEDFEKAKFEIMCHFHPFETITEETLAVALNNDRQRISASDLISSFVQVNGRQPNIEELRSIYVNAYSLHFS